MLRYTAVFVILSIFVLLTVADDSASASIEDASSSEAPVVVATNVEKNKNALPSDLPTCEQDSANLGACLAKVFEIMIMRYKDGNKDLNIPPTDPFVLNRTVFQYSNGPVNGRIIMRNGRVQGFSQLKHKSLDFKMLKNDKFKLQGISEVPLAIITGQYKAELTFNNVRMRPKGNFSVTMTQLNVNMSANGEFFEQDGHRLMRLLDFDADPQMNGFKFTATGIFPDPTLNEIALNVINQYWRDIFRVFLPETRQYWAPMLKHLFNEAMHAIPFDTIVKQKQA